MSDLPTLAFDDRESLDLELADTVADLLADAIVRRHRATLVVSGGSTPVNFFRLLSQKKLDWSRVTVLLADERWVPADHDDSNQKLVAENLLCNNAGEAHFISLRTPHGDVSEAETELDVVLEELGPFDLVILGMGGDGHTASLFPGTAALETGLAMNSGKQCIAVMPTDTPHQRMSMTLPRLLNSRKIFIHITGEEKKRVLERAVAQNDPRRLPIAAVVHQSRTPVTLYYSP